MKIFNLSFSGLIVWSFSKTKKSWEEINKTKATKNGRKNIFVSIIDFLNENSAFCNLGRTTTTLASWRLLWRLREDFFFMKLLHKEKTGTRQGATDRHTENMWAGILTWGWSRRTCNFFAQGLVHEGGKKNRQLGVVCFIHAGKLVPQNKLDDKPWCWSFAHHMRGAVCDCPCPKWSSLGIPTHHGTSSPPPCMHSQTPQIFKTKTTTSSLTKEKQQIEEEKGAANWTWRRRREGGSNRWSKQAWAFIFRV